MANARSRPGAVVVEAADAVVADGAVFGPGRPRPTTGGAPLGNFPSGFAVGLAEVVRQARLVVVEAAPPFW